MIPGPAIGEGGIARSDLLVVPALAVYGGLFVAGAAYFLAMSFWSVKSYRVVPGFTLDNYAKTLATHLGAGATTLGMALAIALSATVIGFCYAWIVRFRAGSWAPALLLVALVTLFGGYLMKIYAWKTMLGSDGAINSALITLGLVDRPIKALLYSPFAVILTLTHFLLPFSILPIFAALRSISDAEVDSARDLGAGPGRVLLDILIPRARGGIVAAFALAFLFRRRRLLDAAAGRRHHGDGTAS